VKNLLGLIFVMSLLGCSKQGPLERAGEEIDEAVEDVAAGGETLGNQLDDAVDDVRREVREIVE
jgi:hypothetical protein